MPDPSRPGDPRVDYDTPHAKAWGLDMALYLLTKGIATGTLFNYFATKEALALALAAEALAGARDDYEHKRAGEESLEEGLFGWQVTDCAVTVTKIGYSLADARRHERSKLL